MLRWLNALLVCAITTIIIAIIYLAVLLLLKTSELIDLSSPIISKLSKKIPALIPLAKIFEDTARKQSEQKQANRTARVVRSGKMPNK